MAVIRNEYGEAMVEGLARVASHLGVEATRKSLLDRYFFDRRAITYQRLESVAGELDLRVRRVRAIPSDIPKMAPLCPFMVTGNDGGVAVVEKVDAENARIDVFRCPNLATEEGGLLVLSAADFLRWWSGEAILATTVGEGRADLEPFGVPWMVNVVKHERVLLRDIGLAALVSSLLGIAPPLMTMVIVDRVIVNHSLSTWVVLASVFGCMIFFDTLIQYARRFLLETTATKIDGRLNLFILRRLLALPISYFETTQAGYILGKLGKISLIRSFVTGSLINVALDLINVFVYVPVLFVLNWVLTIFVLVLAAVIAIIVFVSLPRTTRLFNTYVETEIEKNSFLVETVRGMATIKSLALENSRKMEWDRRVAKALTAKHQLGVWTNWPQTLSHPFERLIYSGSILLGALIALTQPDLIYPGVLMAFAMLAGRAASPLVNLARLMEQVTEIRTAFNEVAQVVNQPPEPSRFGTGLKLPIQGNIIFSDVKFRYAPQSPYALNGASFEIQPGKFFGIMGRSGSGKSTVIKLLQGLNAGYEGVIKIDGMDLREIEMVHLRTHIGVVPQENFLFRGTIRENIAIARPSASFAEIVRAAQLAGAEEFFERSPKGYDTFLEENASNLSGGQRQRLALARALLIDPPVLVLDEATSALDPESEAIINANIARMAQNRTIICVSHRLSMLVPADAIMVMEKGLPYDIGTHGELLKRCDIYRQMWSKQNPGGAVPGNDPLVIEGRKSLLVPPSRP